MRLTLLEFVESGAVLGKTLYDLTGRPLLKRGTELSASFIRRLRDIGYTAVYLDDALSHDIVVEDFVPPELQAEIILEVRGLFQGVQQSDRIDRILPEKSVHRVTDLFKSMLDSVRGDELFELHVGSILNKDESLLNHCFHVALLSTIIATAEGMPETRVREIGLGALLHDIGKVVIPDSILNKAGKLTADEWELVKSHPTVGYDIIRRQHTFSVVSAHCAYQHHERLDGSGYPRGLVDGEIHTVGLITAVADVFEAMTAARPYKRPILPSEAMEYLHANSGTQFDANRVRILQNHVALYPAGVTLTLSDGRRGVVVENHKEAPHKPLIRIFVAGEESVTPYDLDLRQDVGATIVDFHMDPLLDTHIADSF